jgi:hypothetical protein
MIRKLAAVIALLMVATLSVSGCTSTTSPTTNTTTSPTTHDAVLERFVTAYKGYLTDVPRTENGTITAWQVTWSNGTTINIHATARYTQPDVTVTYNRTVTNFPSTDGATAYVRSYNLTGFALSNTTTERGNVSETALGHPLTVLKVWDKTSGDVSTSHTIEVEQADSLVIITDSTVTSS